MKRNDVSKAVSLVAKSSPATLLRETWRLQELQDSYETLKNTERFYQERKYNKGQISEQKRKRFLAIIADDLKKYEQKLTTMRQRVPVRITDRRAGDIENLVDDIMLLLSWLIENVNASKSLSAGQVRTTAELIVEDFGVLATEDIALVFRRAVAGQMGDIYRLDPQVIMKWIRDYKKEVVEMTLEHNKRQHISRKGSPHDNRACYDQQTEEAYQAFKAEYINNSIKTKKL